MTDYKLAEVKESGPVCSIINDSVDVYNRARAPKAAFLDEKLLENEVILCERKGDLKGLDNCKYVVTDFPPVNREYELGFGPLYLYGMVEYDPDSLSKLGKDCFYLHYLGTIDFAPDYDVSDYTD